MPQFTRFPLGVNTQTQQPVWIENDALNLSCVVFGATGSGKTSTLNHFARHAMRSAMPLILIDAKGDTGWAHTLQRWAEAEHRPFLHWSVRGPAQWNPLAEGTPSELKDKLIGLTDWTEPHYRYAGERFLQTLIQCFQVSGHSLTLDTLVAHGDNPRSLTNLARASGPTGERLLAIIDQWDADTSLRKAVMGLMTRLAVLSESDVGPYLSGVDIRLHDVLLDLAAPVVLFSLPKLQYSGLVPLLGALVIQDLKAAIAALYHEAQRTAAMILIDEFGAFATLQALDILSQARGAGMHSIVASQDPLDYAHVAPELPLQVLTNSAVKIVHRIENPDSAELLARSIGTHKTHAVTHQIDNTQHTLGQMGSIRAVDEFIIHPQILKSLPVGMAAYSIKVGAQSAGLVQVFPEPL